MRVHPQLFRSVIQSLAIFCSADDVVIMLYQMTLFMIHAMRMKDLNFIKLYVFNSYRVVNTTRLGFKDQ